MRPIGGKLIKWLFYEDENTLKIFARSFKNYFEQKLGKNLFTVRLQS